MLFFAFHIRSYIKEKHRKLPKPSRKPAVAKIKKKDAGQGKEKVDEAAIPAAEEAPQLPQPVRWSPPSVTEPRRHTPPAAT